MNKYRLRQLQEKDAPFMLEWMHDEEINKNFRFNAAEQTLESAIAFIASTLLDENNQHFAVVDETDEYLGTISLKDIDHNNQKAEYAVCFRKEAQGTGVAQWATHAILSYGFNELGLNRIYLNVLSDNKRAVRFYEKFGFIYEGETKEDVIIRGKTKDLKWFRMLKSEI